MTEELIQQTNVGPYSVKTVKNPVEEGDRYAYHSYAFHIHFSNIGLERFDATRAAADQSHRDFIDTIFRTYTFPLSNGA